MGSCGDQAKCSCRLERSLSLSIYIYIYIMCLCVCFYLALLTRISVKHAEWQIYMLLLGMFLASAVVFYIFFENSDSFWKFPNQAAKPKIGTILGDPQSSDDPNVWGPLDMWALCMSHSPGVIRSSIRNRMQNKFFLSSRPFRFKTESLVAY